MILVILYLRYSDITISDLVSKYSDIIDLLGFKFCDLAMVNYTLMVKADRLWSSFLAPARISRPGTHSASRFMRARYVFRAVAVIGIMGDGSFG